MSCSCCPEEQEVEEEIPPYMLNSCGKQCFIIGGPFITYDPDCSICNHSHWDHEAQEFCGSDCPAVARRQEEE